MRWSSPASVSGTGGFNCCQGLVHGVSLLWRTGARVDVEVMASVSWR